MHRLGYEIHKVESATGGLPAAHLQGIATLRRPSVLDGSRAAGGRRACQVDRLDPAPRSARLHLNHSAAPRAPGSTCPPGCRTAPMARTRSRASTASRASPTPVSLSTTTCATCCRSATDHELGFVTSRGLERTGLLKRSLLVVVADHGYAYDIGVRVVASSATRTWTRSGPCRCSPARCPIRCAGASTTAWCATSTSSRRSETCSAGASGGPTTATRSSHQPPRTATSS